MDALITIALVALAAIWVAAHLFRRRATPVSGSCSSGCDGCALARRGATGCGAVPAGAAARPGAIPALPLRSPDHEDR